MHKISLYFVLIISFALTSCSIFNGDDELDSKKLRALVLEAINGDYDTNVKLSGLIDTQHYLKTDFNQLTVESGFINYKYYYFVLLEYYDPTLNLFAVYDDNLKLLLLDKSLNGNLSAVWTDKGSLHFIFLQERFQTKDVINLDRLSIYEVMDTTAELVYRSLSKLVKDNETSYQTIEEISEDKIVTKLSGPAESGIHNKRDTFEFNPVTKKYLSKTNLFSEYVKTEVADFRWITTKPQIPANTFGDEKINYGDGYQISLRGDWQKVAPYTESTLLKENLTGTRFTNTNLNSSITVLMIPKGKSGEEYALYSFSNTTDGKYKIRSTEVYSMGDNFNQVIEHSCGDNKFLLLIDSPKTIFEQNKQVFEEIISSFLIDC